MFATNIATEYMHDLDASAQDYGKPATFTLRQHMPRVQNPDIDYLKLIVMLGAAVGAALVYDYVRQQKEVLV